MAQMVLDSNILWALVGWGILVPLLISVLYMKLKNVVPEAAVLMQAREKNIPIIMYHYPNNVVKLVFPQLEEKVEDIANYFRADGVYKFWDASGQNYERLNGNLTMYHVLSNVPETVNHKIAAQMSQVEAFLKNSGYPIDGMQDLFFYVLSELEKEHTILLDEIKVDERGKPLIGEDGKEIIVGTMEKKQKANIDEVLSLLNLDDIETTTRIKAAIAFIQENRDKFSDLVPYFRPVPFSFQTMIRSWDNLQAFTSKNFIQAKTIIETAVLRNAGAKDREILMYALGFVIVIAGMVFLMKAMGWA